MLKSAAMATARTAWRARTTSSWSRIGSVSSFSTDTRLSLIVNNLPDQGEALVHVERGADAGQREAELDERNRDSGLHADHHGGGIEHLRHGGNVVEHAADEGIDDRQRRDIDHDAARPVGNDAVGEVVLER